MFRIVAPVKAIIAFGSGGLLLAQIAPVNIVDAAGRLTLDAALVIAVGVLWKAIGKKDERIAEKDVQIVGMATKITETMVLVMESARELRNTVADQKIALKDLPCAMRDDPHPHPRRVG